MAETQQIHKTKVEPKEERIVRILSKDLEGGLAIYPGLAKIKGVSWSLSNAVCNCLNLDKKRKIGSLSEKELEEISVFIKNPNVPDYMKNRRRDFEKGESKHLIGTDLDLRKDFDIKRLKKIKSYRGIRHAAGLPLRGQRTKAHFRKNRNKGSGIKKKSAPVKKEFVKWKENIKFIPDLKDRSINQE